jgi:hypothetical protein
MSQTLDHAKEIFYRGKPYATFPEASPGYDLGFEFVAEEQAFSNSDFAAWTNQAFPLVRSLRHLPSEQDLNLALQEVAGGRVPRAYGLRPRAASAAVQACGKDPRVVEQKQVAGPEHFGKVTKSVVTKTSFKTVYS